MEKQISVIIVLMLCVSAFADRTLQLFVNPYCDLNACNTTDVDPSSNFTNLIYIRATGQNDTLHYLWSSIGTFSVLIARTDLSSNLAINWTNLLSGNSSGSISFDPAPDYVSIVAFTNLYFYDDVKDVVNVSLSPNVTTIPFNQVPWSIATNTNSTSQASSTFTTSANSSFSNSIQFILKAYGNQDHSDELPRLIHTPNSFQLEVIFDHFNNTYGYKNPRFALEIAILSEGNPNSLYSLESHKSIDDEYTPGVFKTVELASANSGSNNRNSSFMQWKPVVYTSTARTTEESTVTEENLEQIANSSRLVDLQNSLAYAYFGDLEDSVAVAWMKISFGLNGDGFYGGFSSWTVTIGIGGPPEESFSTMVIAIIIVGFGVPAVLIIVGGIIILVRRLRHKKDDQNVSSERLVDSDQ